MDKTSKTLLRITPHPFGTDWLTALIGGGTEGEITLPSAQSPEARVSTVVDIETVKNLLPIGNKSASDATKESCTIVQLPETEPQTRPLSDYAKAQGSAWIAFTRRQNARMVAAGWDSEDIVDLTDRADVEDFEENYKRKL